MVPPFGLTANYADFEVPHKRRPSLGGLPDWMAVNQDGSTRSTSAYTAYAAHPPLEPMSLGP